jgi:hypothetical protein
MAKTEKLRWPESKKKKDEELRQSFDRLVDFHPEVDSLDHSADGFQEGDEKAPFFSESYLYNLVGKEDARSILVRIRRLALAVGYSQEEVSKRF